MDTSERFLRLETKVAYQEKLLEEFNEVLIEQRKVCDALERRVAEIEKLIREGTDSVGPALEKPPHY